jgi:hypothetical protein
VADFSGLKRKMLVVVDDIDRLTSDEVCLLFRLIKANTDFPNVIFLLLVQRESAVKALNSIANNEGDRFLEKIIQVPFDLPEPSVAAVSGAVIDGLNKILGPMLHADEWDMKRFPDIWQSGVRHYFSNLREAYRYLNALAFTTGVFKSANAFEVNMVDLIAIEALRIFEPAVYDLIAQNKTILTGYLVRNEKKSLTSLFDQFGVAARNRKVVEEVLPELYPVLKNITQNTSYSHESFAKKWKRARRVCDPEFFDRFFQICLPQGQVSESDIRDFIAASTDYQAMSDQLGKWSQAGVLEPALSRLEAEEGLAKIADPVPFVCVLLDSLENAGRKSQGMFDWDIANYAACWARDILKRTKDPTARDKLARRFVEESKALFPVVNMCRFILPPMPGAKDENDEKLVTPESASAIITALGSRYKKWAEQGNLLNHPRISRLYWSWMYFSEDDALDWARRQVKNPQAALALLAAFIGESTSQPSGSYYVEKQKLLNLKSLEEIAHLSDWDRAFAKARKTKLSDVESSNLAAYEKAKKRRAKGLPENDWHSMREDCEEDA